VFADVTLATYTLDPGQVAAKVGPRTKAIVPVHLYGHPADLGGLADAIAGRSVDIIEDASQAHGARYQGECVGTYGRAAAFSCYFTKNLGAYGEAGLVTAQDDDLVSRLRMLRNHGHVTKECHELVGFNNRMDEIQAAILRIKLRRLQDDNSRRRRIADAYRERLEGVAGITLPATADWAAPVFHLFVIRHPRRNELRAFLQERGIATGIHYAVPIHLQPAMASLGYSMGQFPVTESLCGQILSLPMYPQLSLAQVDEVCDRIRAFGC
jgi:dTDP-4-amino-4,6-dideoxygalactose transaminase